MALTPRGDRKPEEKQERPHNLKGIPQESPDTIKYDGKTGWDTDERCLEVIEYIMAEFVKILYNPKISDDGKREAALISTAMIKAALMRRDKYKDDK